MAGWIKKVKAFQFKGILVILGCFLLIGAILFAERLHLHGGIGGVEGEHLIRLFFSHYA